MLIDEAEAVEGCAVGGILVDAEGVGVRVGGGKGGVVVRDENDVFWDLVEKVDAAVLDFIGGEDLEGEVDGGGFDRDRRV